MLTIMATLPQNMGGLNGNVIYIDTEAAFSAQRFYHLFCMFFIPYFAVSIRPHSQISPNL